MSILLFSAVFPVNIISLFIYCILLIAIIVQSVQLIERKYFHVTYKIFIISVVCEFLGLIFLFNYNFHYSTYGNAVETSRILGKLEQQERLKSTHLSVFFFRLLLFKSLSLFSFLPFIQVRDSLR